jgi:hypothetical protein
MKRVLKHLHETRTGAPPMPTGSMVIFGRNEEAWRGRISGMGTVRNGKTFYYIKDAVSDSGKVQSFDIEGKEIIKALTGLEIEHGYGFYG